MAVGSDDEKQQSLSFEVSSDVPTCATPTVTLQWDQPDTMASFESGRLSWSSGKSEVRFTVQTNCPHEVALRVRAPELLALPWGFASHTSQPSIAELDQHVVRVGTEPVSVLWYLPNQENWYTLRVQESSVFSASAQSVSALLGNWWHGGSVAHCHTLVSLFNEAAECVTHLTPFWERSASPTVQPEQTAGQPKPGDLILSEVNWAGSFRGSVNLSTDEWLELLNLTPESLSLQGLQISGVRSGGERVLLTAPLVIGPYGTAVLARLPAAQSQLRDAADVVMPELQISNTQSAIVLYSAAGEELDRTPSGVWQVGKNQVSPVPRRASAQRVIFQQEAGNQWSAWRDCTDSSEAWCGILAERSLKSDTTSTLATPGMYPPW